MLPFPVDAVPPLSGVRVLDAARVLAAVGHAHEAAVLLACFEELSDEVGGGEAWVRRMNDQTRGIVETELDDASLAVATQDGRRLTLDEGVTFALAALD